MYRSKLAIILKLSIVPWLIIWLPYFLLEYNSIRIMDYEKFLWFFIEIPLVIGVMLFTFSTILRIYGWLFHRHEPEYREYIRNGGDPYFDNLPSPWNTGRPFYEVSVCPRCDSEIGYATVCPNCGWAAPTSPHRRFICPGCHRKLRETNYGDLDNGGVRCPHCGAVTIWSSPQSPPQNPPPSPRT